MPSTVADLLTAVRARLNEPTSRFWTDAELIAIIAAGERDLWRSIVDLKGEHYLIINEQVTYPAGDTQLEGVPPDVYKIYLIEPVKNQEGDVNQGLIFQPLEYNHRNFQLARARPAIDPTNDTIYYALAGQGAPVAPPRIYCAPRTTSTVNVRLAYVPTLSPVTNASDVVAVPGEADNALIAWTVAYARAKERDDRTPDAGWLAVYATEKAQLLAGLGLRQYQEPSYVDAVFEQYW